MSITSNAQTAAITANIAALHAILLTAVERAGEAHSDIQLGECNRAIGALIDLDRILDEAKALYGAALSLHRSRAF